MPSSKISEFDLDPSVFDGLGSNEDLEEIKSSINIIDINVDNVKTDVASIKSNVSTVNTNITSVKNDVATIKTNVETVNTNVDSVKTTVNNINTTVGAINTTLAAVNTNAADAVTKATSIKSVVDQIGNRTKSSGTTAKIDGTLSEKLSYIINQNNEIASSSSGSQLKYNNIISGNIQKSSPSTVSVTGCGFIQLWTYDTAGNSIKNIVIDGVSSSAVISLNVGTVTIYFSESISLGVATNNSASRVSVYYCIQTI